MSMLKELLLNNKVVFAHVQRLVSIDGVERNVENFVFEKPISRYYKTDAGEWVQYYAEKEDGSMEFTEPIVEPYRTDRGTPYSFCVPIFATSYKVSGWVYAHGIKMLLIRLYNKQPIKSQMPSFTEDAENPEVFKETYIEIMIFFEENEYLENYRKDIEADKNENPNNWGHTKELEEIWAKEDEIRDDMPANELAERHKCLGEDYEAIRVYNYAAKHYYSSYIYSGQTEGGYSQSMLMKATQMLEKLKEEGNDTEVEIVLSYFKNIEKVRSKFKFDAEKEESSVGDVVLPNEIPHKSRASTSERPNVGKLKKTSAITLTNYTLDTLMNMASNTIDSITGGHAWLEKLKADCFNTLGWRNVKPDSVTIKMETTWCQPEENEHERECY